MTNNIKQAFKKSPKKIFLLFGLFIIGIGITMSLLLSNGSFNLAKQDIMTCEAQPEAQAALAKVVDGEVGAFLVTANGRGYSDMEFLDESGEITKISAFVGKPILVNFWATWCGPCREEMPSIDRLAGVHAKDKFEVVTINIDTGKKAKEKSEAFFEEIWVENLTLYSDPSYKSFDMLKANGVVLGLPATLILDDSGCELGVLQGPAEWDSDDALKLIDAIIAL